MDCTEAIVNNRSVKTVRKLQVLLSLHDEKQQSNSKINKDFSTCRTAIFITEAEFTLYMQNNEKKNIK